jgi:hypothetical protein
MSEGEEKLSRGDVDAACAAFDQAALMAHAADIELGMLRCQMQAGQYRQALAFAAHTAGVHLDEADGAVFYAWLLNLGSHVAVAEQTLAQAESRDPAHQALHEVRARFRSSLLLPQGDLLKPSLRLAPYASGVMVPTEAHAVATGVLLADGEHALVPRAALPSSAPVRVWLRNGMGQTVSAHVDHGAAQSAAEPEADALPLVMLHLSAPLPVAGGDVVAPRDPFAGSPVFALDVPADATSASPTWPVMRAGFLGMADARAPAGMTRLGVALPTNGLRGGPVYDQGGRLVGIAVGQAGSVDRMLMLSALRQAFGERFGSVATEVRPHSVSVDELYERGMRSTLQVLFSRP